MAPIGVEDDEYLEDDEGDDRMDAVSVSDGSSSADTPVFALEGSSDVSVTLRYPVGYCVLVKIPFEPVYIGNRIGLCIPLHVGSMVHVISRVSVQNQV